MTALSFRTSPLFQAIKTVADVRGIDAGFGAQVDGRCQDNGGDVVEAQASFVRVLRALADKSAAYGSAKGRAEAEAYRAHADAIEAVTAPEGDDAPIAAGYVATLKSETGDVILLAFEGFEGQAKRAAEREIADNGLVMDETDCIVIARVECYADRWHDLADTAILRGHGFTPAGEIAVPYGIRPHA